MAVPVPSSDLIVHSPLTPEDLGLYYALRYAVLREPWGQPRGSEQDDQEDTAIHAFIKQNNRVLACGRIQFVDAHTAQVRYMAVAADQQGKGLGKKVLNYLERQSQAAGRLRVLLHAREGAVKFYESAGYKVVKKSHLLWGQVQHWEMEKDLA